MWFWADLKITAEEEEQKDSDVVKSAVADVLGINESAVNVECTEDENNAQASNCKVTYPVDVEKPIDFDEQVQKALEDKTGANPGDIEVESQILGNFFLLNILSSTKHHKFYERNFCDHLVIYIPSASMNSSTKSYKMKKKNWKMISKVDNFFRSIRNVLVRLGLSYFMIFWLKSLETNCFSWF